MPLIIRGILRLGSSCTIENNADISFTRGRDIGFDLRQLDRSPISMVKEHYLDNGTTLDHVLLFHSTSIARHVFSLFYPGGKLKLHIAEPPNRRQPLGKIAEKYDSLLRKNREENDEESVFDYPSSLEVDLVYHTTEAAALKAVSREVGVIEGRSTVVVISSFRDQAWFEESIPKLSKFPLLMWEGPKSAHSLDAFPWQPEFIRRMLSRYLALGSWLHVRIQDAGYFDVPIGNIDADEPLFYTDIEYARRLQRRDMVLWWSASGRPDLGGVEEDGQSTEELASPDFNYPGCYSNVCLNIQVKQLALNAVAQSGIVNEMEGSSGATAFDSASHTLRDYAKGDARATATLGDSAISPQAFSVMKEMVKTWIEAKDGATQLSIDHFWRWLAGGAARMYDPGLQRFVHGLMRKIFLQMLAEFKRLGSNVIAADFGRILLLTSKPPGTAAAYATYLLNAVTSHELFRDVELRATRFYDFLLYMDSANQGGVICPDPMAIRTSESKIIVAMNWNIESFLPPAVQTFFKLSIKQFIADMFRKKGLHAGVGRTPLRIVQALTQGGTDQLHDEEKKKESEAITAFISHHLTRNMLANLNKVLELQRDAMTQEIIPDEFRFPLLPGSHLHMSNPALEYIKFTCAVFALAKEFNLEVGVLKKNLLDLVNIREFSDDAIFRNPCEPLKLSMVICNVCNAMRDFDFCRDVDLLPSEPSSSTRSAYQWKCASCHCEYDRTAIEAALINMVSRIVASFQLQDLRCSKCQQIKSDNLSIHCNCSGAYQLTQGKVEGRRKIRTIVNVATFHGLASLKVNNTSMSWFSYC